jgi:hypothetical protein
MARPIKKTEATRCSIAHVSNSHYHLLYFEGVREFSDSENIRIQKIEALGTDPQIKQRGFSQIQYGDNPNED